MQWVSSTLKDHQVGAGTVQMSGTNYFYGQNTLDPDTHISLSTDDTRLYLYNGSVNSAALIGGDGHPGGQQHYLLCRQRAVVAKQPVLERRRRRGLRERHHPGGGQDHPGPGLTTTLVNNGDVIATGSGLSLSSGSIDNEGPMTGPLQFSYDTITNNNLIQKNSSGTPCRFPVLRFPARGGSILRAGRCVGCVTLRDHQVGAGTVQISGTNYFYGRTPWIRTPISACPRTIRGCISITVVSIPLP